MKSIIVGSNQGCQKCETLKAMNPEVDSVLLDPQEIIPFASKLNITSLPFVVTVGEPYELDKILHVK